MTAVVVLAVAAVGVAALFVVAAGVVVVLGLSVPLLNLRLCGVRTKKSFLPKN